MTYQIIFVDHLLAAILEGSMAVPRRFRVKTSPPMHGLEESDSGILPETPAKKPKRKAHVLACASEILPPARTAYALFFASVYDSVKEGRSVGGWWAISATHRFRNRPTMERPCR